MIAVSILVLLPNIFEMLMYSSNPFNKTSKSAMFSEPGS